MTNPYAWNRINLDLVYGRKSVLNELLSSLPASQALSFALAGGRRMGKTTVLRLVEKELFAAQVAWRAQNLLVIPVYIDGLALPRPLTAEYLWGEIFRCMSSALSHGSTDQQEITFADFLSKARLLLDRTPEAVRIIVLSDEIEPILLYEWADGYFANWRALLSNVPGLSSAFSAVFAGARELVKLRQDVGSPLMDILEFRSLRNLTYDECHSLIQEPSRAEWGDDFYQFVYQQSGGQPMLIQYLMHAVSGSSIEGSPLALAAASAAVQRFLDGRGWQFSDLWYKSCSPASHAVYRRLPSNGTGLALSALTTEFGTRFCNEAIEILQHVGVVEVDQETLAVKRIGGMFSAWQELHGPAVQSAHHDTKIYEMLGRIDLEFAMKYAAAWGILASEQPNYSGAVSEIRDTITLVLHRVAPNEQVSASPGFKLEPGQENPTRRQRAKYAVAQKQKSGGLSKTLSDDLNLFEAYADNFASFVSSTYGFASGLTHTTSTYDLAYQALKQADSILAQILG